MIPFVACRLLVVGFFEIDALSMVLVPLFGRVLKENPWDHPSLWEAICGDDPSPATSKCSCTLCLFAKGMP